MARVSFAEASKIIEERGGVIEKCYKNITGYAYVVHYEDKHIKLLNGYKLVAWAVELKERVPESSSDERVEVSLQKVRKVGESKELERRRKRKAEIYPVLDRLFDIAESYDRQTYYTKSGRVRIGSFSMGQKVFYFNKEILNSSELCDRYRDEIATLEAFYEGEIG